MANTESYECGLDRAVRHGNPQRRALQTHALLFACALIGCGGCDSTLPVLQPGSSVVSDCFEGGKAGSQFGDGLATIDSWVLADGARLLEAAGLPRLWCGAMPDTYRVLWVPTRRPLLAITLQRSDDGWAIETVESRDPRQLPLSSAIVIERRSSRRTEPTAAEQVAQEIEAAGLWTAPVAQDGRAEDGAGLIVEVRQAGRYRGILRVNTGEQSCTASPGALSLSLESSLLERCSLARVGSRPPSHQRPTALSAVKALRFASPPRVVRAGPSGLDRGCVRRGIALTRWPHSSVPHRNLQPHRKIRTVHCVLLR